MNSHRRRHRPLRASLVALLALAAALTLAQRAQAAQFLGSPTSYSSLQLSDGVALGDFNEDGHLDAVVTRHSGYQIMLGSASGTLTLKTGSDVGGDVEGVAVGDFDDDGHLDLAIAGGSSNVALIFWGNGDGTFSPGPVITDAGDPVAITAADLNHDGRDDIATANHTGFGIGVALAGPARTFGALSSITDGDSPTAIANGDINGDGSPDLLVTHSPDQPRGSLRTDYNDGNGTFLRESAVSNGDGGLPGSVAVGDFNHDGRRDAATTSAGTSSLSQYLNSAQLNGLLSQQGFAVGAGPTGVAAGDLTGDGIDDAVTSNASAGTVSLLAGSAGGLTAPVSYPAGAGARAVAVGDLNGDGMQDVLVADDDASTGLTVLLGHRSPTLQLDADTTAVHGQALDGLLTLVGTSPHPSGALSLKLYGPNDTTCTGTPVAQSSGDATSKPDVSVPSAGAPGTYRWTASYSGDDGDDATTLDCGAVTTIVTAADVSVSLSVPSTAAIGDAVAPTATLSSGQSDRLGEITFQVYSSSSCSGAPLASSSEPVGSDVTYATGPYMPAHAGTLYWLAVYSGDGNYAPSDSTCQAPGTTTDVAQTTPALSLSATSGTLGGSVDASAVLAEGSVPTGTIHFSAYVTADCSGVPAFAADATVNGDGTYGSGDFTPPHAGSYSWLASYDGDGDNTAVSTTCGEATAAVAKAQPTLSATATATARRGEEIGDSATIADSHDASGDLVFALYASDDCGGAPIFTSDPVSVAGDGDYASPTFTPSAAGVYRWIATYSGDDDNAASATSCDDAAQRSTVTGPAFRIDADSADFGSVEVGHVSDARSFTVTNDAAGATAQDLHFDAGALALSGAGFVVRDDHCDGVAVAPGEHCTFAVAFAPAAAGPAQGTITLTDDAPDSPQTVTLRGTGTAPTPDATPTPTPVATPTSSPSPTPTPVPALRITKVSATRCTTRTAITLRFTLNKPARITLTLQRRIKPIAAARTTCPKHLDPTNAPAKYGNVHAARVVPERLATVSAAKKAVTQTVNGRTGANTVSLRTLIRKAKLKPGRYRVVLRAGSLTQTASFWVLARHRRR